MIILFDRINENEIAVALIAPNIPEYNSPPNLPNNT